jgi:hypothetical protein
VFEFIFCPATVSASVHVRARPGGKHCSDAVTSGRPAVVFQPKKNSVKKCLTSTMMGRSIMQECRLPPILRTMLITMHNNYRRQQLKNRSEKAENVSGSRWDNGTGQQSTTSSSRMRLHALQKKRLPKAASAHSFLARRKTLI